MIKFEIAISVIWYCTFFFDNTDIGSLIKVTYELFDEFHVLEILVKVIRWIESPNDTLRTSAF